jgi:repressor of nif and glnA expression
MGASMDIVDYLQGQFRHSIDVLLAIYELSSSPEKPVGWKQVREWFRQRGKRLPDGTFRKRRNELEQLKLVRKISVDPLKFNVAITPKGVEVARALEDLTSKLKAVENET